MQFLPAGFACDDIDRHLQILDAAGDVGIARATARLAVIFMIHGPAIEAIAGEFIHDRVFAMPRYLKIERPRGDRRAMDEEQHRTRGLAGFPRAEPLAINTQADIPLLGPLFAAPHLAPP